MNIDRPTLLGISGHERAEGNVVFAPAGGKHRHGALDGKDFTHISITRPNSGEKFFDD